MCNLDVLPLDCFRLLAEMDSAGVNNTEVGRRMGVNKSTVLRWKNGSQPEWRQGQRLLALHEYVCRKAQNATQLLAESEIS